MTVRYRSRRVVPRRNKPARKGALARYPDAGSIMPVTMETLAIEQSPAGAQAQVGAAVQSLPPSDALRPSATFSPLVRSATRNRRTRRRRK